MFLPKHAFKAYDQISLGVTSIMRLTAQDIKTHFLFLILGKLKWGRKTKAACFKLRLCVYGWTHNVKHSGICQEGSSRPLMLQTLQCQQAGKRTNHSKLALPQLIDRNVYLLSSIFKDHQNLAMKLYSLHPSVQHNSIFNPNFQHILKIIY